MRIKLPHTPGGSRLCRLAVHRTLPASRAALFFVSFFFFFFWLQSPTKGAPFPTLLYKFLVHIVNRDISQQVFWNIFLLVFQSM